MIRDLVGDVWSEPFLDECAFRQREQYFTNWDPSASLSLTLSFTLLRLQVGADLEGSGRTSTGSSQSATDTDSILKLPNLLAAAQPALVFATEVKSGSPPPPATTVIAAVESA